MWGSKGGAKGNNKGNLVKTREGKKRRYQSSAWKGRGAAGEKDVGIVDRDFKEE